MRATLEEIGDEVPAVICEAVVSNAESVFPRPGYVEELRRLTGAHGVLPVFDEPHGVLPVFDEVITGFRARLSGAHERFDVGADLAVFGKALSGRFPLSKVSRRRNVVEQVVKRGGGAPRSAERQHGRDRSRAINGDRTERRG